MSDEIDLSMLAPSDLNSDSVFAETSFATCCGFYCCILGRLIISYRMDNEQRILELSGRARQQLMLRQFSLAADEFAQIAGLYREAAELEHNSSRQKKKIRLALQFEHLAVKYRGPKKLVDSKRIEDPLGILSQIERVARCGNSNS